MKDGGWRMERKGMREGDWGEGDGEAGEVRCEFTTWKMWWKERRAGVEKRK